MGKDCDNNKYAIIIDGGGWESIEKWKRCATGRENGEVREVGREMNDEVDGNGMKECKSRRKLDRNS